MRATYSTVCAILLAVLAPLAAQPKLPREVTVEVGDIIPILSVTDADEIRIDTLDASHFKTIREFTDPKMYCLQVGGKTPGVGYIILSSTKGGKLQDLVVVKITVKGVTPPAPVPVPVPPKPPTPKPPEPIITPIEGEGFRVLVIFEAKTVMDLPPAQWNAVNGEKIRNYLETRTPWEEGGKSKAYRIFPKSIDLTGESDTWKKAMERPRTELPWIIISRSGRGGFEGPLPKTADEIYTLLDKYGGP